MQGTPITGYLLEAYGGPKQGISAYCPAIFYAGSLIFASVGMVLAVQFLVNRKVFA